MIMIDKKELNKVTPLSKAIAGTVLLGLPFIFFFAGLWLGYTASGPFTESDQIILEGDGNHDVWGSIYGANLENIPIDKLPECEFTGEKYVETPCYAPPGVLYD